MRRSKTWLSRWRFRSDDPGPRAAVGCQRADSRTSGILLTRLLPGFWECIAHHLTTGRLLILGQVRDEILFPPALVTWVEQAPQTRACLHNDSRVVDAYGEVMEWAVRSRQFADAAKNEFARIADPWLVAYAMANDVDVVTNEVFDPSVKKRIKIPNACRHFGVEYQDTYAMLRALDAQFDWSRP